MLIRAHVPARCRVRVHAWAAGAAAAGGARPHARRRAGQGRESAQLPAARSRPDRTRSASRWSIVSAAPASTRSTRTSASTRRSRRRAACRTLVDHRAVQCRPAPAIRRAGGAIFSVPPERVGRRGNGVRADDSHDAGAPRISRPGQPGRSRHADEFYQQGRKAATSRPASSRRWRACSSRRGSCTASRGAGDRRGRAGLSHQRRRAGVAPVVLPVEQHSRRRAARRGDEGPAARSAGAGAAGEAHARRPEGRRARREFRRAVAVSARAGERADRGARTSTTTCGGRSGAKPRCCSAPSSARIAASSI